MSYMANMSFSYLLHRLSPLLPALLVACIDPEEPDVDHEVDDFYTELSSEDCTQGSESSCCDHIFDSSYNTEACDPVPQAAASWMRLPGSAYDIGVNEAGAVMVIGTNPVSGGYGIYSWNGSAWTEIGGGAVRIAVDPTGQPWVVNNAGRIYRRTEGAWQRLPGLALDIGIGSDGSAYVIGLNTRAGGYGIYHWNGLNWNEVGGGAVRVAVDANGQPWVTNDADNIYRWTGGGWQHVPGRARDIGVGASGAVWVIGNNAVSGGYGIYHWDGAVWNRVDGGAIAVSVDAAGLPWVVNANGGIFRRL